MRKQIFATAILMVSLLTTAVASPQPMLELSVQQWNVSGVFDYKLHYPNSSKLLSLVSAPQRQGMPLLNVKLNLDKKSFMNLSYGQTDVHNKGRGSDSDWTNPNSNSLTYYGDMEFHGQQEMWSLDYGQIIAENRRQKTIAIIGWGERKTTNELRNVIYHLVNEVDVGNQMQSDNGSALNGKFSGLYAGIRHDMIRNDKLVMKTSLTATYGNAKAYGYWANHTPAWNWVNTGNAVGYGVTAGLEYRFDKRTWAEVGYSYHCMKSIGASEVLNGSLLSNEIDLRYVQQGMYFGMKKQF